MIDRLIYLYQPASEYVVVITGDLIDDATKRGQLTEAKSHIERIKEAGFNLLMVPGNYDYGTGSNATNELMRRYKQEIYGDSNVQFPRFDPMGEVAFIGLDSMEGEIKKKQGKWADGKIGKEQLERLDNLLSSQGVANCQYTVVYLHHHPINKDGFFKQKFHGLDDAKELKKVLVERTRSTRCCSDIIMMVSRGMETGGSSVLTMQEVLPEKEYTRFSQGD